MSFAGSFCRLLLVFVSITGLLLTVACGGNSGGAAPGTHSSVVVAGPVHGFVWIEERSGKHVLDAWFSREPLAEPIRDELWRNGDESCHKGVDFSASQMARDVGGAALSDWKNTLFVGDSIVISARDGVLATLVPQRFGDAVLYAMQERWLSQPLPEDAHLSITGSDQFPAIDGLPLAPLTAMTRLAPVNGVLTNLSQEVLWEPSALADDRVELVVSLSPEEVDALSPWIACSINDSGSFVLPPKVQATLPADSLAMVTLVRTRRSSFSSLDSELHLVQSSFP